MATLAPQITPTGITSPSYADVLAELQLAYWSIFGTDAILTPDSQDGQYLAIVAQAVYDCGQTAVAIYNSFPPSTSQGTALSSMVKLNGLRRLVPSSSQVVVTIGGETGTEILSGLVGDNLGLRTQWALPDTVTIPNSGTIDVTATCTTFGATPAAPASITIILTSTRGWQTVTNVVAASLGSPTESDAALRQRQSQSMALPAQTPLESLYGAVANIAGVSRVTVHENDTDVTDSDGVPSHSVAVVVLGGDVQTIAETIALEKLGTGTYGDVVRVVVDSHGVPTTIRFFELATVVITVEITVHALVGYAATTGDTIKQAVADFITALDIGEDSYLARLYTPANLGSVPLGATFVVTLIKQARSPAVPAVADVAIVFNEAATCVVADITLTVV